MRWKSLPKVCTVSDESRKGGQESSILSHGFFPLFFSFLPSFLSFVKLINSLSSSQSHAEFKITTINYPLHEKTQRILRYHPDFMLPPGKDSSSLSLWNTQSKLSLCSISWCEKHVENPMWTAALQSCIFILSSVEGRRFILWSSCFWLGHRYSWDQILD